jgi:hypothetical protein
MEDILLPAHIVQCEHDHLPTPQAVYGQQQQDRAISNVLGAVRLCAGDQPLNVLPTRPQRQHFVLEQSRPLDPGCEAVVTAVLGGEVSEKRP